MDLQERTFLERLKQLNAQEQQKFDLNLSGTSATIMMQTPKKIYLAWVGDCHATMCKKERKVVAVKLTGGKVLHTP